MSESNVVKLAQPGVFTDSLTEILRSGARALLTQAVEAEVADFLAKHADLSISTIASGSARRLIWNVVLVGAVRPRHRAPCHDRLRPGHAGFKGTRRRAKGTRRSASLRRVF